MGALGVAAMYGNLFHSPKKPKVPEDKMAQEGSVRRVLTQEEMDAAPLSTIGNPIGVRRTPDSGIPEPPLSGISGIVLDDYKGPCGIVLEYKGPLTVYGLNGQPVEGLPQVYHVSVLVETKGSKPPQQLLQFLTVIEPQKHAEIAVPEDLVSRL